MPAQLSYAGTPITPERTKAALEAADKALEPLAELFADAPRRLKFIPYNLIEDGEGGYRWAEDEVDILIRKAIAFAAKERRDR